MHLRGTSINRGVLAVPQRREVSLSFKRILCARHALLCILVFSFLLIPSVDLLVRKTSTFTSFDSWLLVVSLSILFGRFVVGWSIDYGFFLVDIVVCLASSSMMFWTKIGQLNLYYFLNRILFVALMRSIVRSGTST
jgi:hypothetical protein